MSGVDAAAGFRTRQISEGWAEIGGQRVHYLSSGGEGPPLILLHGGGTQSASLAWGPTLPALARRHRVYAPEWPGYGLSPAATAPYTTELLIQILDGLMGHWGISRADLLGMSMGGGAALGYALRAPERVRRLGLVGSYGLSRRAPCHRGLYLLLRMPGLDGIVRGFLRNRRLVRWQLQRIAKTPGAVTDALVEEVMETARQGKGSESFHAWLRSEVMWGGLRACYLPALAGLRLPVLLLHGEHDPLVPVSWARQAAARLPEARLVVLPGCGHWPSREAPEAFVRIVEAFLEDRPDSAAFARPFGA